MLPAITAALAGLAATTADAQRAERPAAHPDRGVLVLTPARAEIERLVIERGDPLQAAPERHAITDAQLRLSPAGADGRLAAEVIVVVAGRIVRAAPLACRPWSGEATVCIADCDGGSLSLRRVRARQGLRVLLTLGGRDGNGARGVALDACAEDDRGESALVPRPGLAGAEVTFSER